MKYKTHNQKEIEIMAGTSFAGTIKVSYSRLVECFGNSYDDIDEYKTDANWIIQFEDGVIVIIYNWKNGRNYLGNQVGFPKEDITEWHIGTRGKDRSIGLKRINHILRDGNLRNLVDNLHSDINDLYLAMDGGKCGDDDILNSLRGINNHLTDQLNLGVYDINGRDINRRVK
jgi:hypothetical protein